MFLNLAIFFFLTANEETARLIKLSKGQVYAYQVDLTKREEIYRAADRLKQEVGKVWK